MRTHLPGPAKLTRLRRKTGLIPHQLEHRLPSQRLAFRVSALFSGRRNDWMLKASMNYLPPDVERPITGLALLPPHQPRHLVPMYGDVENFGHGTRPWPKMIWSQTMKTRTTRDKVAHVYIQPLRILTTLNMCTICYMRISVALCFLECRSASAQMCSPRLILRHGRTHKA